jgi:hypothetical protein
MKFANAVREAIVHKNETLGIALDATKATERGQPLGRFLKNQESEMAGNLDSSGDHEPETANNSDSSAGDKRFEFTEGARFQASYLDIFVEDAIFHLTERAKLFYWYAGSCVFLAIAVLIAGIYFVVQGAQDIPKVLDVEHLVIRIFSSLAIAGLVLVAAKGLLFLIRAFLHEATRLLERRHALRFGKLFFYLKLGKNFDCIDLTLKDIQEAFQWNKETSTAFQDIRPEVIADTIINQMARMPSSIIAKGLGGYFASKGKETENSRDEPVK